MYHSFPIEKRDVPENIALGDILLVVFYRYNMYLEFYRARLTKKERRRETPAAILFTASCTDTVQPAE